MTNPFRLDGRTALVTGGASGIGEAVARVFTTAGARVTIVDIDQPRAEALARELPGSNVLTCDITNESAVRDAFRGIPALDILVNNAGIGLVGGVEETAEFFLLRLRTVGYYLPKRVLTVDEAGVLRSRMADALNERATLNLNGSG